MALHVSIQGDSLNVSETKKVMLRALNPGIFIQTDKAVYKPGQEGERGTTLPCGTPLVGERGQEAQPCSCTPGNGRDYPGLSWNAEHGHRAIPGLAGGCAARGVDFHPPSHGEFFLPVDEATPPSPFPFAVKFRIVSLDKDLIPSNQKVRAGLGRGEVTRAPCSVPASRGRWERCGSHLCPWECCPGQLCPGSCPWGRDALCPSGMQQDQEGESRGQV